MFDGKAFGLEVVSVVKAHVEKSLAPILARLDAIEAAIARQADDTDSKVVNVFDAENFLSEALAAPSGVAKILEVVASAPKPELPDFPALIAGEVEKAVSAIEKPQDGKDADLDEVKALIEASVAAAMPEPVSLEKLWAEIEENIAPFKRELEASIEKTCEAMRPKDGHSPTTEEYGPLITEAVQKAVSAIPVPKDGVDGKDGRDGCDIADAMQDKDGNLVVTFTDGRIKTIGNIQGKDGAAGKDGANGKDGLDGVGFDDMSCDIRDDGVYLMWEKGEVIKEARLPVPIDRGVWKEGSYKRGESVTWGGSFWIAQEDTTEKPENGKGWRMAVKRGRDGRDGVVKELKPVGPVKVG